MIRVRIAPEKIIHPDDGPAYNAGGRRLMPYETPHGKAFEPGESLEVTQEWLEARRHWHFLEVVQDEPAPEVAPSHGTVLEAAGFKEIKSSRRTVEEEFLLRDIPEPAEPIAPVVAKAPEAVVATKRKRRAKTTEAK